MDWMASLEAKVGDRKKNLGALNFEIPFFFSFFLLMVFGMIGFPDGHQFEFNSRWNSFRHGFVSVGTSTTPAWQPSLPKPEIVVSIFTGPSIPTPTKDP